MKKHKLAFILIAVLAIAAVAFSGCGQKDPDAESAIAFSGGGTLANAPTITASLLRSDFHLEIDASSFVSGDAKAYTGVSSADAEAYVGLYLASGSGWTLLMGEPLTFYKSETIVLLSFNEDTGTLAIVTVHLKSGSVAKLKESADKVTHYYSVTNPAKTEYAWGEDLDLAGFAITRTGSDGSSKILVKDTDYTIDTSGYDKNTAGYYYFPYSLIGGTDLSGNISVRVMERDIIEFTGGSASSFNQVYSDAIVGKLTVTPPTGVTEVTVSYRTKTAFSGEYGAWSQTEPSLTTVGELFAEVKFSKDGYEDKVIYELYIRITARPFDNADSLVIVEKNFDYDGTTKSVTADFDVPDGAKVEYQYGTSEWSETAPSFTDAGRYEVWFRVTKDTYQTVSRVFIIWIHNTEVPGVTAPSMVHIVAGEALNLRLNGVEVGDVITYSTDGGNTYAAAVPSVTSTRDIKVKVTRGNGYESVFTVKVVYVPDAEITGITTKSIVAKVSGTDNYYLTLSLQGGTWDDYYVIVRTSVDNGATWGNWIDVNYWYNENIPVYSADGLYKYNFRLISTSGYKDFEHTLTLPYRYLTSLEVTTAPTQSNYMVGDTFNPEGIVVKKIYQDGYEENASPGEYEFIDFDNNIITAATVFNNKETQTPIRVRIGYITSAFDKSFRISVYDPAQMYLEGAVLRVQTPPTKTVYDAGEIFSLDGIVIEAQIQATLGTRWFEIPSSRYGIRSSDTPDMLAGGQQTVRITAKQYLSGTFINDVCAEFDITVNYPFAGTSWYTVLDEPGAPPVAEMQVKFLDNQNALLYLDENPAVTTEATYTAVKDGGNFVITLFKDGHEYRSYTYNPASGALSQGSFNLTKLNSADAVLSFTIDTPGGPIPVIMVAVGGKLSAAQIDGFAAFGKFYLTDEVTPEGLITTETQFNEDTVIYCIFEVPDYTGEVFLGYYELDGMLLAIDENQAYLSSDGMSFYYTAEESDEQWTLTAGIQVYVYNKPSGRITTTLRGEDVEFTRLDETVYAVVTVTSENTDLSYYCGQYIVEKGKPFPSVRIDHSTIILMTFADYGGAIITGHLTIELTGASEGYGGMLSAHNIFGNFARNFIFDLGTLTVTMSEAAVSSDGSFKITGLDYDYIYITLTFGATSFDASVATDYPYAVTVSGGEYAGSYSFNDWEFYVGLPFVLEFSGVEGQYITLTADGFYQGNIGENYIFGRYEITGVNDGIYTILFAQDENYSPGLYDSAARVLTYNGMEFDAPAIYVGRYTYRGTVIEFNPNGSVNGIVSGNVSSAVTEGTQITITVSAYDESTVTLVYDITADTISYNGDIYTKYNPVYEGKPFTTWGLVSEESVPLMIDDEGNVSINYTVVGYISDLDEQERTFTVNYYDGANPPTSASYTDNSVTIGETTYSKPEDPELPFENAPFVGKDYINGDDILFISPDGDVWLGAEWYAELLNYDEADGRLVFYVINDDEIVFGAYDSAGDSVSIGDVTYTFIPKG